MKKFLFSLLCFGALNLNAEIFLELDFLASKIKEEENVKFDEKSSLRADFTIQSFNINNNNGSVGLFRFGASDWESDFTTSNNITGKIKEEWSDFDLMLGYGYNLSNKDIVDKEIGNGMNILIGLNHQNYKQRIDVAITKDSFLFGTQTISGWRELTIKTNALKLGINGFTILHNNIYLNYDIYLKHYLDDNRNYGSNNKDGKTKFEASLGAGYKFGGNKNGVYVGIKAAYLNNLMGKGLRYGLTCGYKF